MKTEYKFKHKKIRNCYKESERLKANPCKKNVKRVRQTSERLLKEFIIKQGITEDYKMLDNGNFFFLNKDKEKITQLDIETNEIFEFEDILIDLEFRTPSGKIFDYYDYKRENENENYLLNYEEFLKWKS